MRTGRWVWTLGVCLACAAGACGDDSRSRLAADPGGAGSGGAGTSGSGGTGGRISQTPLPLPASQLAPGSWCEFDGWCWYNPLPSGDYVFGVAGAGPTDLWFGGASSSSPGGTTSLLHFVGGRWSIAPSPLDATESIWASSSTDVWFAGALPITPGQKAGALAHWDGTSMAVSNGFPADLMGTVWGSGPSDVYAGGTNFVTDVQIVEHWDGHAWSPIPELTGPLNFSGLSIAGSGPNDVWVGGSQSTFHFDGKAWTRVAQLDGVAVQSLAVPAAGDVWLITNRGGSVAVEHLDASGLTVSLSPPTNPAVTFNGLGAVSSQDIWLVGSFFSGGDQYSGYVSHFDGQSWHRAPDVPTSLSQVANAPGQGVFAVGNNGEMVRLVSAPSLAFTELRSGTDRDLAGVFGNAPTDMWAVGDAGTVWHYDGSSVAAVPGGTSANLKDVWGTGPSDIWAVGDAGTVVHFDGRAFTPVSAGTTADLKAVFTAQPNDVWIGGDGGVLLHGDGAGFSPAVVPGLDPSASVLDLHGIAPDDVWLSGGENIPTLEDGFVAHFDGHAWSPVDVLTFPQVNLSQPIERVWQLGPSDVWATVGQLELRGGGPRAFWHFDGTAWTSLLTDPAQPSAANPYVFPNFDRPSFVFSPHDRWRVDLFGWFQRNTN